MKTGHTPTRKTEKAFSISKMLAYCLAAPDPSHKLKLSTYLVVLAVKYLVYVYTCTEQTGRTALN